MNPFKIILETNCYFSIIRLVCAYEKACQLALFVESLPPNPLEVFPPEDEEERRVVRRQTTNSPTLEPPTNSSDQSTNFTQPQPTTSGACGFSSTSDWDHLPRAYCPSWAASDIDDSESGWSIPSQEHYDPTFLTSTNIPSSPVVETPPPPYPGDDNTAANNSTVLTPGEILADPQISSRLTTLDLRNGKLIL